MVFVGTEGIIQYLFEKSHEGWMFWFELAMICFGVASSQAYVGAVIAYTMEIYPNDIVIVYVCIGDNLASVAAAVTKYVNIYVAIGCLVACNLLVLPVLSEPEFFDDDSRQSSSLLNDQQ